MKRRFSLRQRFGLFIVVLFVLIFGALATLLISRKISTGRTTLNEQSKSFATLATKPIGDAFLLYKDSGKVRIQQQTTKFTDLDPDVTGVTIVDTSAQVQFFSGRPAHVSQEQATTFDPIYLTRQGTIHTAVIPLLEDYGAHRYSIVYTISDSRLIQDVQHTLAIIALLSLGGFILAMIVTYWLIDILFLSPVSKISAKALKISSGNLEDQIQLNRHDELGDLAAAVNTMANSLKADIVKLQEADKLKTEFIVISSHNLRTPLTAIKGNLELLQDMDIPESMRNMISALAASTASLDTFIEDLLAISTIESGELATSDMKPQPLKELLEAVANDYAEVATQQKLAFNRSLDIGDQQVVMNRHLLRVAFINLLQNAFKFTEAGSVSFRATPGETGVVIKVSDTGTGIAAPELPKLFTKFHRGTDSMRYDYQGTGIGLYLTKLILDRHQGIITVDSTEDVGTTFTVTLPIANDTA